MQTKAQHRLLQFAEDCLRLAYTVHGNLRSLKGYFDKVRTHCKEHDLAILPVGFGNHKTAFPGWYRPTGCGSNGTCPSTCPHIDSGCYARNVGSNVERCARRASAEPEAAAHSYVACAIASLLHFNAPHRALVSGDLCRGDKIDVPACRALVEASRAVQRVLGLSSDAPTGYGYTHAPLSDSMLAILRTAGVIILRSDALEPGAAVVYPLDEIPALREKTDVRLVECPAFRRGATCRSCQLCPRAHKLGICIVLDPHGTKHKDVTETARAMY